ncbi:MAG: hypothetical protein HZB61_07475 [Nitrospirae bacterium]|nr:hypothetical protein [Nitrospirota bacterium]
MKCFDKLINIIKGVTDFFKSLGHPQIILIIILLFYIPLKSLIITATERMSKSSQFSIGNIKFQLDDFAQRTGDKDIKDALQGLSFNAFYHFLVIGGEYGDKTQYTPPLETFDSRTTMQELHSRGLIELLSVSKEPPPDRPNIAKIPSGNYWQYKTTEKGRKVHKILMRALDDQLLLSQERNR